jgi:hypothetical protein
MPAAFVEPHRIIPQRRVPRLGHHLDFLVGQTGPVPIDDGRFHDRVLSAVHYQSRLPDNRIVRLI